MFKVHFILFGNGYEIERTVLMPNPCNLRVVFGTVGNGTEAYLKVGDTAEWDVSGQVFRVRQRSSFLKKMWEEVGFRDVSS